MIARLLAAVRIWFAGVVFRAKCRAGFRLLGWARVTGTVRYVEASEDGDLCFGLKVDDPTALYYGTRANGGTMTMHACEELHCEVVPADRARLAAAVAHLAPGVRVRVTGQHAWDGAHHGKGLLFDVLMVLLRAAPTVDGWLEIHPVFALEIL